VSDGSGQVTRADRGGLDDYAVPVAGATLPLRFHPGISRCGVIDDGVSFEFGDRGSWVMSYATLMELARIATEWRASGMSITVT